MEKETSEIVKLTERVAKDPKSKLFVPLAEEYRKTGDIEMAIYVLIEGLKNNPGYVTARSTLGRLYMEQGNLASAQKELEEVIKVIPDNLLAQRKLGDIYVLQGNTSDALQRFKTCLALNPDDKDLIAMVADLEAGRDISTKIARPKVFTILPEANKPASVRGPAGPKAPAPGSPPHAAPVAGAGISPAPPLPARLNEATASLFTAPSPSAQPKRPVIISPPDEPAASQPTPALADEAEVVEEIVELEPLDQIQAADSAADSVLKEATEIIEVRTPLDLEPPISAPDLSAFDLSEPGAEAAAPTAQDEQPAVVSWEAAQPEAQREPQPNVAVESVEDISTNTLADLYLAQGFYDKAIEIYQGVLSEHPENETLRQKLAMIMAKTGFTERNASQLEQAASNGTEADAGQMTGAPEHGAPMAYTLHTGQPAGLTETVSSESPISSTRMPQEEAPQGVEILKTQPAREEKGAVYRDSTPDVSQRPLSQAARRQETLDRLEHWLKNIMKEKP